MEVKPIDKGDRVEVDLSSEDMDSEYDSRRGTVTEVQEDDLGDEIEDPRMNYIYSVEFDNGDKPDINFRYKYLVVVYD